MKISTTIIQLFSIPSKLRTPVSPAPGENRDASFRCWGKLLAGLALVSLAPLAVLHAAEAPKPASGGKGRQFNAQDVFDYRQPLIFQDAFQAAHFGTWNFSEDDRYRLPQETPERIQMVDAPGLGTGHKAVRFAVRRGPNSFRSEISLPHEPGFHERWYGERIYVPGDWVFDPGRAVDIVLQWHALPGNWKATFPNLEISIGNTNWFIRQSFGSAQTRPMRVNERLAEPVQRGAWVAWVIHAKWSPGADGVLQIWRDGKLVLDRKGPNVYSTIGVDYTPYLKTGIYHPEWHLDKDGKREAFDKEHPVATNKVIYATDIKIGDERASYEAVCPGTIRSLK